MEVIIPQIYESFAGCAEDPADSATLNTILAACLERDQYIQPEIRAYKGTPVRDEYRKLIGEIIGNLKFFRNRANKFEPFRVEDLDPVLINLPPPGAPAQSWAPVVAALIPLLKKLTIREGVAFEGLYVKRRIGRSNPEKQFTTPEAAIADAWENSEIVEQEENQRLMASDLFIRKYDSADDEGKEIKEYTCQFNLGTGGLGITDDTPEYLRSAVNRIIPILSASATEHDWFGNHMKFNEYVDSAEFPLPEEETINPPEKLSELLDNEVYIYVAYTIDSRLFDYSRGLYKYC